MEKLELYPVYNITAVTVSINKDGKYVIKTEHYPISSGQELEDKIEKEKIPTEIHIDVSYSAFVYRLLPCKTCKAFTVNPFDIVTVRVLKS